MSSFDIESTFVASAENVSFVVVVKEDEWVDPTVAVDATGLSSRSHPRGPMSITTEDTDLLHQGGIWKEGALVLCRISRMESVQDFLSSVSSLSAGTVSSKQMSEFSSSIESITAYGSSGESDISVSKYHNYNMKPNKFEESEKTCDLYKSDSDDRQEPEDTSEDSMTSGKDPFGTKRRNHGIEAVDSFLLMKLRICQTEWERDAVRANLLA
jgi:hypothetical protein